MQKKRQVLKLVKNNSLLLKCLHSHSSLSQKKKEEAEAMLERRKLINLLKGNYNVALLSRIFNISRSAVYNDFGHSIRDVCLAERLYCKEELKSKSNAWSSSIIQYENYFFSNILLKMRLSKLKIDTAPKQRWMQQHGFSPFIHAINEGKLKNYGISNVTDFWKYLGMKLNYEKGIWSCNVQDYADYFKKNILPKIVKQGLDTASAPSTSWLDKNGYSVFRRMVRKKLLLSHNQFFTSIGLKVWEKNKWTKNMSQYRGIVANHILPKMLSDGHGLNTKPKNHWLRENGFRPFVAAIEHGKLSDYNISTLSDFWGKIS